MSAASAISPARLTRPQDAPPSGAQVHATSIGSRIRAQGSASVRVLNGDMFPWMRSGDQVFVRRWDFGMLRAGDVIMFERKDAFFVHRVVRVNVKAGNVITKGDALDAADTPVSADEFVGRATRIHRGKRHIDIESLGQVILARTLARVSGMSRLLYVPFRFVKHLFV